MAVIYIDNVPFEVADGQNLLSACLSLGFDVPHFCWHPALHSVGACRQCAVKMFRDEKDTRGFICMSCMTDATNGVRISIDDPDARQFRSAVIEWLMQNHPHDCPVCDEGGECHLQDMTVMTGHAYRTYRFRKRTYRNQYLGPFINHEMNRCIQCYRCVRFYRDYAGGRDFHVSGIHTRVYFGRFGDGPLENEFSGNLVEVCPTGVFTDKTFKKHFTRKWDLQTAPSICPHCGLGCNTIPGERYGTLRRIHNRFNGQVNGYFLCDRGRFGYEFVNGEQRIRQPLRRRAGRPSSALVPFDGGECFSIVRDIFQESSGVIGIGSPRASLETNFVLRSLVGADRFSCGMTAKESALVSAILSILRRGPARFASIHDVETADAALVLGEDVTNTAPRLALALRQAAHEKRMDLCEKLGIPRWNKQAVLELMKMQKGALFTATPFSTKLDNVAAEGFHGAPADIARLGFGVAHNLSGQSRASSDLTEEQGTFAAFVAKELLEASRPVVVSGTSCGDVTLLQAAANVAWALSAIGHQAALSLTLPECNSLGLGLLDGRSVEDAFDEVGSGRADTVVIVENDLFRRADAATVEEFLGACKHVVVIDQIRSRCVPYASVILPAATVAESSGTLVNSEGRAQRFYQVFRPAGEIRESRHWLREMMLALGRSEAGKWDSLDHVVAAMAKAEPELESLPFLAPNADFRISGKKVPRQPHRYSGRTAMVADMTVHEPAPPADPDSALCFSMEGYEGFPPPPLIPRFWAPGWNSAQALLKFQTRGGDSLRGGDPGLKLIKPSLIDEPAYFAEFPERFESRAGEWLIVPAYHVFGSEELSALAPGIEERSPTPYLGLGPEDQRLLRIKEGEETQLIFESGLVLLPVKTIPSLRAGLAVVPVGLPALKWFDLPAWGKVAPAPGKVEGPEQ